MKNVFITGIAGFLGSHLADRLIGEGYVVYGCDNLTGGYLENVPQTAHFYLGDCTNLDFMNSVLQWIDIVYHAAAYPHEGLSVFSPHLSTRNNIDATASVISAAVQNKVKRFVFLSSMARYGKNKIPFKETMKMKPQDPYGVSKAASEELLKILAKVHGMEYVIAVPHNIIGPRQKYDDPYRNVVSIMINLMLQGRQPYIYGDGRQKRCFSFVDDCVDILVELGISPKAVGRVFNIGPDDELITINELARKIAKILDFKLKPIYVKDRPQEVKIANCSSNRAKRIFGYNPKTRLEDGLKQMISYIRERGTREFTYHLPLEIINNKTPTTWRNKLF